MRGPSASATGAVRAPACSADSALHWPCVSRRQCTSDAPCCVRRPAHQLAGRQSLACLPVKGGVRLQRCGVECLVLEASGKVGGRVSTTAAPGFSCPLDLGASIITGACTCATQSMTGCRPRGARRGQACQPVPQVQRRLARWPGACCLRPAQGVHQQSCCSCCVAPWLGLRLAPLLVRRNGGGR